MSASPKPFRRHIRRWSAIFISIFVAGALLWVWFFHDSQRQDKYLATTAIAFVGTVLGLLWVLFLSGWRGLVRGGLLGGMLMFILLSLSLLRIRGVTGDMLPIFEWRWSQRKTEAPPPIRGKASAGLRGDFPQFLGPTRNAVITGIKLRRDWNTQPPELVWRRTVQPGWSGFAVQGERAVTQEQWDNTEAVVCYSMGSGEILWSHRYEARYFTTLGGEGPRATPTISDNRVYAVGATGRLNCLDLATGALIWTKDFVTENGGSVGEWGMSGSPLIVGDIVAVSPGGKEERMLVAYSKADGKFIWGGGKDEAAYSSPVLAHLGGADQIVSFNAHSVTGHSPTNGQVLWETFWRGGHPHVSVPVILPNNRILISSGYGTGSTLFEILHNRRFEARQVWHSKRMKAKFTNLVYKDGFIYGLDDGIFACIDAANGELKWKEGRYGHGQMLLVGELFLVTAENGEVILVEPNPQAHNELARFEALDSKTWNPPALAGQFLLVRNDKEAACYRLPAEAKQP